MVSGAKVGLEVQKWGDSEGRKGDINQCPRPVHMPPEDVFLFSFSESWCVVSLVLSVSSSTSGANLEEQP